MRININKKYIAIAIILIVLSISVGTALLDKNTQNVKEDIVTDETVTVDIVLQTGYIVTGIITTSDGTPLANAYVSVSGTGYGSATTDFNGKYIISGLPAGNYFISVSPPYGSNLIMSNQSIILPSTN